MGHSGLAARQAAVFLLDQVLGQERLMSEALGTKQINALEASDRARAHRLAMDTLRSMERCDRILKPFVRKAPPLQVQNILRLATYELCSGGAAHGVVNDAVQMVSKTRKTSHLKGLANAVLRKVADKGPEEWGKLRVPRLPKWLRGPLAQAYGTEAIAAMETAHMAGAPLDISCKVDADGWAEKLGATVLPTGSLRLNGAVQVSALPGFDDGAWWVQDAAAALPVQALAPQAGEAIADLCCAPGGKTMQLAAAGAKVTAIDSSERRMARVSENLARTGLEATLVVGDALDHEGQYDAILLDAPCSATGTLRRHPDLPFAKDGSGFGELIELQAHMLAHAVSLVKPGGRLVYCTCSLLPDEGECQIDDLLEVHPEMTVDRTALDLPGVEDAWRTEEGGLRLRPDYWAEAGGMDGFYIAVLKKADTATD